LKPGPLLRKVFRAPVWLYEHRLGWLLGTRFLCVTHVGRKSGHRYRTVLEVIATRPCGEFVVIAGMGPGADWYRNIQANPAPEVVVSRHAFRPAYRVLDESEAVMVIADYERRNRWLLPILRPVLSKLLGWHYDGSTVSRALLVRQLPVVAFHAVA
jgi:deazaflavin-dependent oxidoreductase (nitroreductase family)